ncbi:MAG: Uma2 family endonuclease [Blastochloris sp.]|nr:Uma2 family endonuclease [Blastochloris sp.]
MTTLHQPPPTASLLVYPESDGQPMAENTEQFRWIVMIKENLEALFFDRADVFVAGDLLWYPREGHPDIRRAPDAMVVFGRPKGRRGSYRQWLEDHIAPQVVFEILSPGNTLSEILEKRDFYEQYGVEEYYLYNPDTSDLAGMLRQGNTLHVHTPMHGWRSPRLGIRFDTSGNELCLYAPDGQAFLSFSALKQQHAAEHAARQHAEQRAERLAARLRELGIEPDDEEA